MLPAFVLPFCLVAQAIEPQTRISVEAESTHRFDATVADKHALLAQQWGLKIEELDRYRALMLGPLGTYSPNLDPLSALGIEARTDAERQHYALLQVDAESARVEKLLVYQRAYDHAWKLRYPDLALINLPPVSSPLALNNAQRVAVFVEYDCAVCDNKIRQMQASGASFDLFVVNSQQQDRRLRQWAQKIGIQPGKVREGIITINHDNGRWGSISGQGQLPAVMLKVNGKWVRQ
ncbi:TIGR03759 family integrating conjugative element protein [Pseudomonas koreensis]